MRGSLPADPANQNGGPFRARRRGAQMLDRGRLAGPNLALEALLEALDLAGRVDDRLLAREERVAVAADVDAELGARGSDCPLGPAGTTVDRRLVVLGMDFGLHWCSPRCRPFGVTLPRRWSSLRRAWVRPRPRLRPR